MAEQTRFYATGKRKNAIAKVWLTAGEANITVNKKSVADYFHRRTLEALINQPFEITNTAGRYTVVAQALGGGVSGQAGALRHGISKALVEADPELRPVLRRNGYLTRDPRVKESKKYGHKRARRGFQFSKR
ncbi:MAG: 30S ribosomal protein S9 [bacterium]|jgi:small subunit ribosomal protein S9